MKITYIDHSGYLLETETASFLFDYYKGDIPEADRDKPLIVCVSHRHPDHYNPKIFDLLAEYPMVYYILDKDCGIKWKIRECEEQGISLTEKLTRVRKNTSQDIMLPNGRKLSLTTYKSTDEGVAFLLEYEGKTFYHAGDLNLWAWKEESDQYNDNMRKAYLKEMEKLRGKKIDAAFVPLDPRQREYAFLGMEIFMEYTDSSKVFPMHLWRKYSIIRKFAQKHPEYADRIVPIEKKGQEWRI